MPNCQEFLHNTTAELADSPRTRAYYPQAHDHDSRFGRAVRRAIVSYSFSAVLAHPSLTMHSSHTSAEAQPVSELQPPFTDSSRALPFVTHATERLRRNTSDSPQSTVSMALATRKARRERKLPVQQLAILGTHCVLHSPK